MQYKNLYDFLLGEEQAFKTARIEVAGSWRWSFYEHVLKTVLYLNSQFIKGADENKPFKNIIRPIINLQNRAEGFDVKDIELFVNDSEKYYKSFLIRKFHEKWAREEGMDTFIDAMVESFVAFGGTLVKRTKGGVESVPFQRIAFCDQTDILSGAICEKHYFSPSELLETASKNGWDADQAQVLAQMWSFERQENYSDTQTTTPTPYIEIYEVHGNLPSAWLDNKEPDYDDKEYLPQVHICGFYKSTQEKDGSGNPKKNGVTLFSSKESKPRYKFLPRDGGIYGRALGMGGVEELMQAQIWTNYSMIHKKNLMDSASKTIFQTADGSYHTRNNTSSLPNNAILVHEAGKPLTQVNTFPANIQVFDNSVVEWQDLAQRIGAASDPILGEQPKSGTPFRLQALVTQEAHSLHEYRKGKLATFLDEIYKDWVMVDLAKKASDIEFLAELDLDEAQSIAEALVTFETNKAIKEKVLNGEVVSPEQVEAFKFLVRENFKKTGNKKFIKILKDEFKDAPIDIKVNIAGKQKYSAQHVEKLNNVFASLGNPQVLQLLQTPQGAKIFNSILENSNLPTIDFSDFTAPLPPVEQPIATQT